MLRLAAVVLCALTFGGCGCFAPVGECDARATDAGPSLTTLEVHLPLALHGATAVYDGRVVWVMGGMTAQRTMSAQVFRFDPRTETLETMPWTLPVGRQASVGASLGGRVWLFGGRRTESTLLSEILEVDTAAGTSTVAAAKLPTARYATGIAVVGEQILLFGGFDYSHLNQVLRFTPSTGALTVDPATLSPGRDGPSTFAVGDSVFLLGGGSPVGTLTEVVRFDSATSTLEKLSTVLPNPHWAGAPGFVCGKAYLYGGTIGSTEPILTVTRFDPATGEAGTLEGLTLPEPYFGASTASVGRSIYIFGGANPDGGAFKDTILRLTP